ncbi:MAG: SGNH/GDSL hydrolase family protein [Planctomycetota bacterium]|nr:MAG: SGNH/GDSL hydrolase family protein [Planctomycetota bacterium]
MGPEITIIEFGLNDCSCDGHSVKNRVSIEEYRANLKALAKIVHGRGGQPILVANHLPMYSNEPPQPDGQLYSTKVAAYNAIVRELAQEMDLALIDAEAHFAAPEYTSQKLRADGLHLNLEGNHVYARALYAALRPFAD